MFARTERLTLRPAWPEDAAALTAIGEKSFARLLFDDPSTIVPAPTTHEPRFVIEVHEAPSPTLIGTISLSDHAGDTDLAFWLTPSARGHGYATEAARAVVDMARHALPITRLRARHCATDPASARVLEKLGFHTVEENRPPVHASCGDGPELLYALDVHRRASPPPRAM